MKLLGFDFGAPTLGTILLLMPLVLVAILAVGGGVIWGVTNVWDLTIHSVDTPNPNYWESVMFFAGFWLIARILDKS